MYTFNNIFTTNKKSKGINKKKYIILHHTGGGDYKSNCKMLSGSRGSKSVHFVVGVSGEAAKIGSPTDILRHSGISQRGDLNFMNSYSMGIEVVGPNSSGAFSNRQYRKVIDLVKYLMVTFGIPKENVIKHSDITWSGSKNKRLWDGKSPARKTDLSPRFWHDRGYTTYTIWRDSVLK